MVYAHIDVFAMSMILNGGNPSFAAIFPSGFSILPDNTLGQGEEGCILTIAFQSADSLLTENYMSSQTLRTIDGVLTTTAASIKDAIVTDRSNRKFNRKRSNRFRTRNTFNGMFPSPLS